MQIAKKGNYMKTNNSYWCKRLHEICYFPFKETTQTRTFHEISDTPLKIWGFLWWSKSKFVIFVSTCTAVMISIDFHLSSMTTATPQQATQLPAKRHESHELWFGRDWRPRQPLKWEKGHIKYKRHWWELRTSTRTCKTPVRQQHQ